MFFSIGSNLVKSGLLCNGTEIFCNFGAVEAIFIRLAFMILRYRVSLPGIKGFARVYELKSTTTLYDFHKRMRDDIKDNGSRFIALAYPVETLEQIREIVSSLKKEYHDARHHCYAYRLGYKGDVFRANDDGEPSSSAGRPILGQIDSNCLSDILIVVVRYFGGIKLGIPGLIRAYKSSSADALAHAEIITKTATRHYRLSFGYMEMNGVMKKA